jgi:hypothetical protein
MSVALLLLARMSSAGFTELGYCWYCGPTCFVRCPWSSFYPCVRLPALAAVRPMCSQQCH